MKSALVLTVIGPDKPGLVEALAATVAEHGGNWEQSRMARLGGQFAGILKVSAPTVQLEGLRASLDALGSRGLRVVSDTIDTTQAPTGVAALALQTFHLEVVGNDREGIVREVSRVLAEERVNVEELDTSCESAAMMGGMLFHADALVSIPKGTDVEKLRKRLEAIADDLMVDVQLVPKKDR